jgi:HD-like signal output (HDOD) protein
LRTAPALASIRQPLNDLWELSVNVASLAFVAARSWSRVSPDRALLAGLMHAMGRIYILSRSVEHPGLFSDMEAYHQIERDWHATIAKIVLESWDISPDIVEAVEQFERPGRKGGGDPDLTDVLAVAHMLASLQDAPEAMEAQLAEASASRRLGITPESVNKVLQETASELASLHTALGA